MSSCGRGMTLGWRALGSQQGVRPSRGPFFGPRYRRIRVAAMDPSIAPETAPAEPGEAFEALDRAQTMVRGLDGTITHWSSGMQRLYGYGPEDAIGRRSHELLKSEFPRSVGEITSELIQKEVWNGEVTNYRKDGAHVCVASIWSSWQNGGTAEVIEVHADITHLKLAEQDLAAREAHLKSILETVPDAMIVINERGVAVFQRCR